MRNTKTDSRLPPESSMEAADIKRRSFLGGVLKRLIREKPLGTVGLIITLLLLLTGIFADFLAPYGYNDTDVSIALSAPSTEHWLGTDNLGRDLLSRIIYGARVSVITGLSIAGLSLIISVTIGVVAGYVGGKLDFIVQRFVDTVMTMPTLLVMIILASAIGAGMLQLVIILSVVWGIVGSRIIRSAVIGIRENVYFEGARAIGCSVTRILVRHVLPNIMAPAIILFTTRVPAAIMVEAGLSFIGYGLPPPTPTWGGMISGSGRSFMYLAPWMAIWPGVALSIVVYGINIFGDALRDILDPRLKGGSGRYVRNVSSGRASLKKHSVGEPHGGGGGASGKSKIFRQAEK